MIYIKQFGIPSEHLSQMEKEFNETIKYWQDNHAGYYGQPHGYRQVWFGIERCNCGYGEWNGGHRWLTSGGNMHIVSWLGGGIKFTYSGRRHGMRGEFASLIASAHACTDDDDKDQFNRNELYATREPEWKPWQTRDTLQREVPFEELDNKLHDGGWWVPTETGRATLVTRGNDIVDIGDKDVAVPLDELPYEELSKRYGLYGARNIHAVSMAWATDQSLKLPYFV